MTFGIETPAPDETVSGIVSVRGFVLNLRPVSQITLMIDGQPVHDADINHPRPDVRWKYPKFEGEPFPIDPGFVTSFLATDYDDGAHTLAVRVRYNTGTEELLGERTIYVDSTLNQAPIGMLDSPRNPATYGAQDQVSGVFPVVGWALDDTGIRQRTSPSGCNPATDTPCAVLADIEVMVDGTVVGQSLYPLPRPDVANAYPDIVDAYNSGFTMFLDTTRYTNGMHTISVRAWDTAGASSVLGVRQVWIENNYGSIGPFGKITWPMDNGHFFSCSCNGPPPVSGIEYDPENHIDWVAGWVIDQNDNPLFNGVVDVELWLNNVTIKRTDLDCAPMPTSSPAGWANHLANCYGLERLDVLYQYPQFLWDAKYSGFFFAVDTDYWLRNGHLRRGLNILEVAVRTKDPTRPPVVIDRMPIIVQCNEDLDQPAFGDLERPQEMRDMRGTELLKGWVVDFNYVNKLEVWVDGVMDGYITEYGGHLNMMRTDIELLYPWIYYPHSRFNGFEYMLDTTKYVDGVHTLVLRTIDRAGHATDWVERPVRFDNFN